MKINNLNNGIVTIVVGGCVFSMNKKEKEIERIRLVCMDIETLRDYRKMVNDIIRDKRGKQLIA